MIPITKPFLPPKSEFLKWIDGIWDRNWLTNNGPLVKKLEIDLKGYLDVPYLLFLGNGTIALQIAIKALELQGEIITTPFSYVATTNSIVWENCTPVFADIDSESLNINPVEIEKAISPNTTAIMATHVFGNPCDVIRIQEIADRHNLKVIYDAAHAFGVKIHGKSIMSYGDISTCSFHATKIFHTIEGGAVISNDEKLSNKMSKLRNFGHAGPYNFEGVGINGKNSEFHAAMGLANFPYINKIKEDRKRIFNSYDTLIQSNPRCKRAFKHTADVDEYNYSYYPIQFDTEAQLVTTKEILHTNKIQPRRYFYPSLNKLSHTSTQVCPISDSISKKILCLPSYYQLNENTIKKICSII